MSKMEADQIQSLTTTADRALKMVYNDINAEIECLKEEKDQAIKKEKFMILEKLEEKVNIGLEEASILLSLSHYIGLLEAEKVRFMLQNERVRVENQWLLEEQQQSEKMLQKVMNYKATIMNERDVYRAAYVLRKMNPQYCDQIVSEFSKLLKQPEITDENLTTEAESCFSSRMKAMFFISLHSVRHNEFDLARLMVNQMLEKITNKEDPSSPDVASAHEILAMIDRRQGLMDSALSHLKKSLEIRERRFSKDSLQVSVTLNNLSICQSKLGMFEEAMKNCLKSVKMKEKIHGPKSPEVAKQLHNLALVCTYLGRFADAHAYFKSAISIYENASPIDEEKVLKTKNSIAMCLLCQNRLDDAEKMIKLLIDTYHEKLLRRKPSSTFNPSIYMIIDTHASDSEKALLHLNNNYGSINSRALNLVARNLCTLYRKQKEDAKADILNEWLARKPKVKKIARDNNDAISETECSSTVKSQSRSGKISLKRFGATSTRSKSQSRQDTYSSEVEDHINENSSSTVMSSNLSTKSNKPPRKNMVSRFSSFFRKK